MNTFIPDLIIEVTGACNRVCFGCYAPNIVSNEAATTLYEKQPEIFLGILALNNALNELERLPSITSIRGGEPSLHPKLPILLRMVSSHTDHVVMETHGRWLLPENVSAYQDLIQSVKRNKVIVKISFDKMHGMKKEELQMITDFLSCNEIDYKIAITESTLAEYVTTRSLCSWIDDEKIILQMKATNESDLVKPLVGTINVRGELKKVLTHKFAEESIQGVAFA